MTTRRHKPARNRDFNITPFEKGHDDCQSPLLPSFTIRDGLLVTEQHRFSSYDEKHSELFVWSITT